MHESTNLTPFSLFSSCHPPGATTFGNPTASPIDVTAKIFPHELKARIQHCVAQVQRGTDNRVESSQQRYKTNTHDREVLKAPRSFINEQYIYLHCPPTTTSTAEGLAPDSSNKLMIGPVPKTGPFQVIEVSPATISIDKDGI